jgi:hypothetical protein
MTESVVGGAVMTGEEMVQVTRFAVALSKMSAAATKEQSVELTAEENIAMVATIKVLTSGARKVAQ